jgi:hypothetical protein
MPTKRYTTQSWTCEVADLTWQVCKWSPQTFQSKALQAHEGPVSAGIGTPRVEQNQTSQRERGKRSAMVRRLIWLRNHRELHFRMRDGVSPVSMTCISKGRMDGWSLLAKGPGSRSWVLVVLIICWECSVSVAAACVDFSSFGCLFPTVTTFSSSA